jgi:hypothetical protein
MTLDEIATEWAAQSMTQSFAWDGKGKSPLRPCYELAKECESHHNAARQAER